MLLAMESTCDGYENYYIEGMKKYTDEQGKIVLR